MVHHPANKVSFTIPKCNIKNLRFFVPALCETQHVHWSFGAFVYSGTHLRVCMIREQLSALYFCSLHVRSPSFVYLLFFGGLDEFRRRRGSSFKYVNFSCSLLL